MCVFCDSFLCSISLFLLSDSLSCVLNSVVYTVCHCSFIRMSSFSPCSPAPSSTSYTKVQRIHYQLLSANGINSLHMKCMFTYLCNLIIVHEVQAYPHTVRYNTCAVEHIQLHYTMKKWGQSPVYMCISICTLGGSGSPRKFCMVSKALHRGKNFVEQMSKYKCLGG